MADKKVEMQRLNLDLPKDTIETMKLHSKEYPACIRKNKGNAALFARLAIAKFLQDEHGVDSVEWQEVEIAGNKTLIRKYNT